MEVNLILLFVYIILYNIVFANGVKIQKAIYKVPRNHPDIRKCAMEILQIVSITLNYNKTPRLFQSKINALFT
jgi:hypothetical protein